MHRARAGFTTVTLLTTLLGASACVGRTAPSTAMTPSRGSAADSLATQLADLELRRIALQAAGFPAENPALKDSDVKIAELHARIRSIRPTGTVEHFASERVLAALDLRAVTVACELEQRRLTYTDEHPTVRLLTRERDLVEQRRSTIRASLAGAGASDHFSQE